MPKQAKIVEKQNFVPQTENAIDILFRLAYNSGHKAVLQRAKQLRGKKARIQVYCRTAAKRMGGSYHVNQIFPQNVLERQCCRSGHDGAQCVHRRCSLCCRACSRSGGYQLSEPRPQKSSLGQGRAPQQRGRRLAGRAGVPQLEGLHRRYAGHEPHVHLYGLRRAGHPVRRARGRGDRL